MIFLDTETCGLMGPAILIQWAEDDGPVTLHHVWDSSVRSTLELIERICDTDVCAFNLTFDWFHLCKLYNVLQMAENKSIPPIYTEFAQILSTRPTAYCLRPLGACDLFLTARKGEWQTLMDRKAIKIKRVPTEVAHKLAGALDRHIELPEIYFARAADVTAAQEWQVEIDEDDPLFADVSLKFRASSKLKTLCSEVFKTKFIDYPMPREWNPPEAQYHPYQMPPELYLREHCRFWRKDRHARSYAEQDVILLQRLYHYFGEPEPGDTDSELAVAVANARFRGFDIDDCKLDEQVEHFNTVARRPTVDIDSHIRVKRYLKSIASPAEAACITNTRGETLEKFAKHDTDLGRACKIITDARSARKILDILKKVRAVGRFCPDFKIIGTRSGRMAGGSGKSSINPQGIPKVRAIRSIFTMGDILCGGDFDGFEVTIADGVYKDPALHKDLQSGKSFHGLLGSVFYELPYDQIMASKGSSRDYYSPAKGGAFGWMYGAQPKRLGQVLGISEGQAELSYQSFIEKYKRVGISRQAVFDAFCSMRQPGGIGTPIEWRDPADYIETLLGFRRYFTLENNICRTLFQLAENPPKNLDLLGTVVRRDRKQTIRGATQSALFACCFNIQAQSMRAAANHVIQGTGAQITKEVQLEIWNYQPKGIHPWVVQVYNVHDEILAVCDSSIVDSVRTSVAGKVDSFRVLIPLIKMDWKINLRDWSCV